MKKTEEIFIENLKRLRKAKFSQNDFAPLVGFESVRGYQKYEQGESAPTPEILDRFAKALGCEPWELLKPPTPNHKEDKTEVRHNDRPHNNRTAHGIPSAFAGAQAIRESQKEPHDHQARDHVLGSEIAAKIITELKSEFKRDDLEFARLKKEIETLRAELNEVDHVVREWWPKRKDPPFVHSVCLYFLTGDKQYTEILSRSVLSKVETLARALGTNSPKARA